MTVHSSPIQNKFENGKLKITGFLEGVDSEDQFMFWLKEMMNDVSLNHQAAQSVKNFISSFSFSYSFYGKYSRTWDLLKFS
jgi:hypothetical protein